MYNGTNTSENCLEFHSKPWWPSGKEPSCNAGDSRDTVLIPGLETSPLEEGMATHSNILA